MHLRASPFRTGIRLSFLHDMIAAALSLPLAALLRFGEIQPAVDLLMRTPETWLTFLAIFSITAIAFELPSTVWRHLSTGDLLMVVRVAMIAIVSTYITLFVASRLAAVPRSMPPLHWLVLVALMLGSRLFAAWLGQDGRRRGPMDALRWQPVLLAGASDSAVLLSRLLRLRRESPFEVVGILDERAGFAGRNVDGIPVLGGVGDLDRICARLALHGADPRHLVLAEPSALSSAGRIEAIRAAGRQQMTVHDLHDFIRFVNDIPRQPAASRVEIEHDRRSFAATKRLADIALSASALATLAPVFACLAAAVAIRLGRPVIFHQIRPGRGLAAFTLYKFRTLAHTHRADGSIADDHERISRLGRFMRRTRLDELPQLWNVLRGDMSLIGPRPLLARHLAGIGADLHERASLRPGITGWAQVHGGHQLTGHEKLALDLYYIRNYSPRLDLVILAKTAAMVLFGEKIDRGAIDRARNHGNTDILSVESGVS
ncbi:MAG: sugar transferase [Geminicoccaceae bacterium]|nr:sugar transferase [Geminicoccaceae bacterium]